MVVIRRQYIHGRIWGLFFIIILILFRNSLTPEFSMEQSRQFDYKLRKKIRKKVKKNTLITFRGDEKEKKRGSLHFGDQLRKSWDNAIV